MKQVNILLIVALFINTLSILGQKTSSKRVDSIHAKALTVDSHTDTPLRFTRNNFNIAEKHDVQETRSRVDLPRMMQGGLDAIFFAAFVGQDIRTVEGNEKARKRVTTIIDSIYAQINRNSDIACVALAPKDAYKIEEEGKRAIYIGIENGYALGKEISLVKSFYERGVRYITLCHTKNNDICDSSTDSTEHEGLSDFGIEVVEKMNELGIMIDVSHASDNSFYDVVKYSKVPIIASHSNARSLCQHPRNLDDKMLHELAKNNGVIQVCFVTDYIKKSEPNPKRDDAYKALRIKYNHFKNLTDQQMDSARKEWYAIDRMHPQKLATVSELVDHIDHIVKVAGINHVGIGTDFDGGGSLADCMDVSQMKNITNELVKRGYNDAEIIKIWGGNLMRVFQDVMNYAEQAKSEK